jgi:hypothetical protein
MDTSTTNFFGISAFIMSSIGVIYGLFKHKEIKKKCFGRSVKITIDESRRDIEEAENESTESKSTKG